MVQQDFSKPELMSLALGTLLPVLQRTSSDRILKMILHSSDSDFLKYTYNK